MKSKKLSAPSPQTIGWRLIERLLKAGFPVDAHDPTAQGYRVKLECGLVVNIHSLDSIMVQGSISAGNPVRYLYALMPYFPAGTRWQIPDIRYPDTSRLGIWVGGQGY